MKGASYSMASVTHTTMTTRYRQGRGRHSADEGGVMGQVPGVMQARAWMDGACVRLFFVTAPPPRTQSAPLLQATPPARLRCRGVQLHASLLRGP